MMISRLILGTGIVAAVLACPLGAFAAIDNAAAQKEEVAQLRNQIVQLQGQIAVLEKKVSRPAAHASAPVIPSVPVVSAYDSDDPFAMMDAMELRMQNMMGSYGMGSPLTNSLRNRAGVFNPDYDIKENDKAYLLTFDMPGMDKTKINVEVKEGVLQVSGERSSETQEGQPGKTYRQQRSFGYFSRMIPLPKDIDPDSVSAKYDNGVLTVTVGKKAVSAKKDASQKVEVK
jgi:HSP20 family molecular chaperone IbpA